MQSKLPEFEIWPCPYPFHCMYVDRESGTQVKLHAIAIEAKDFDVFTKKPIGPLKYHREQADLTCLNMTQELVDLCHHEFKTSLVEKIPIWVDNYVKQPSPPDGTHWETFGSDVWFLMDGARELAVVTPRTLTVMVPFKMETTVSDAPDGITLASRMLKAYREHRN